MAPGWAALFRFPLSSGSHGKAPMARPIAAKITAYLILAKYQLFVHYGRLGPHKATFSLAGLPFSCRQGPRRSYGWLSGILQRAWGRSDFIFS
jgi:hypothetical protein